MLLPMLRAVEGMLTQTPPETLPVRVECARIIIGELITSLDSSTQVTMQPKTPLNAELYDSKNKLKKEFNLPIEPEITPDPETPYQVIVDDNQKLMGIKGLPLDAKVEIDGKIITHQEAIGKKFSQGRIL